MRSVIGSLTSAVALLCCGPSLAEEKRPNILWLTFEDTSADFIGCYGNTSAKTPNIDQLAKSGTRFESAFSTGAVSSPSRFCLITGVKAFSAGNGSHRSAYPVPDGWEGFPYYLRQAGYYTSNNSKTDYNLANPRSFIKKAWNDCSGEADWRGRKPGQPFFAVYNSMSSHQSRTMTDPWSLYEQNVLSQLNDNEQSKWGKLPMPAIYLDSEEMQKNISRVYNSITKTDKEFGEWLDKLQKDGLRDSTIIFCFSDHGEGIPRGKCSPVSMGYRVPFIVWIPPMYAHLSPFGSGVITEELVSFEDFAPTVLALAGVPVPEHMEGKVFLGRGRSKPKQYVFSGLDRTDENIELSRSVCDGRYIYTRCFMPYQPFVRWMMYWDVSYIQSQIRKDYNDGKLNKLQASVLEAKEAEYLYDIRNDQWETINLVSDKRYASKLNELRYVLKENLIKGRDAGFIPENKIRAAAKKNIPPYYYRLDSALYDADSAVSIAFTVGEGLEFVDKQISALTSSNDVNRFWGAVGLFCQKQSLNKYEARIIDAYVNSKDAQTKVYLLAALIKNCGRGDYQKDFLGGLFHPYMEVQRLTLQLLMNMDDSVREKSLPEIEKKMLSSKLSWEVKNWCKMILYKHNRSTLEDIESDF